MKTIRKMKRILTQSRKKKERILEWNEENGQRSRGKGTRENIQKIKEYDKCQVN